MPNGKNKSLMSKIVKNSPNSSLRIGVVIITLIITVYFGIKYFHERPNETLSLVALSDRSETYKVKVIPNSLDDKALNLLPKETFSYLAMIDAGSSGCRAHVYRYGKLGAIDGPLYILPQHVSKKVKPGLSSFATNPKSAGESLTGLVAFIKEQVPEVDWSITPIWLKATAGLRMLPSEQSNEVISSVAEFLSNKEKSPFLFRTSWAKIISGSKFIYQY